MSNPHFVEVPEGSVLERRRERVFLFLSGLVCAALLDTVPFYLGGLRRCLGLEEGR